MFSKKMEYGYIILKKLELIKEGEFKLGKDVLKNTNIPYNMGLSILTELSNSGLIVSNKGKNGGFYKSKKQISFLDLFIALEANQKNINTLVGKTSENEEYCKKVQKIGKVLLEKLARVEV
ncbi:MAG: Rrf2 family transcriptional regulator [Cetobacterium sp.]